MVHIVLALLFFIVFATIAMAFGAFLAICLVFPKDKKKADTPPNKDIWGASGELPPRYPNKNIWG